MKVVRVTDAEKCEPQRGWMRASTCNEKNISLEYFVKPPGHSSPTHHHPEEQVCVVIRGKMRVKGAGGEESLIEPGDAAYFESNEPHAIENALDDESAGVDIFVPGRSFDFWMKRTEKKV